MEQTDLPSESDASLDLGQRPLVLEVAHSLGEQAWISRCDDDRLALAHAQRLGVPELIGRVLAGRGVALEDGEAFLRPNLKTQMPDPHGITDMEVGVSRLMHAIHDGDPIAIFGDYDVDGATSSALLHRFFRSIGVDVRVYIPDRMKEGYGPNIEAFSALKEDGIKVIVTVDCGAMAFEPLAYATENDLDVIVVDHHQTADELPRCTALINPNREDDVSDLGQLAAVGVTFFLVVALNRALRDNGYYEAKGIAPPDLMALLDLVALGTVCDVVPLTGVNRALVTQGLKVMGKRKNTGLRALGDAARMNDAPGTYHAGFLLGPRINAGGRVGRADLGTRLLSTTDEQEALGIAYELDRLNGERREIEVDVLNAAMDMALSPARASDAICVVAGEGWHAGVIGIVASRLKDRLKRPAFVLAIDDTGLAKGSGRSISGVDLGHGVAQAVEAGLLVNGGGHKMAAGLTVASDRIDDLRAFLNECMMDEIAAAQASRGYKIDGLLAVGGASRELAELLATVGPYGAGHPEPVFALPNVSVLDAGLVGDAHVRCTLTCASGGRLKGISFRSRETPLGQALLNYEGKRFHLAGRLRADNWNGRSSVQLQIEDGVIVG